MLLREKDKNRIIDIADKIFTSPIEIWAYGSRVNGTAHDTSDLDLVIRTKDLQPVSASELHHFQEAVEDSNIPIMVQIFDWARIPESFHHNINKNYEVLKD